MSSNINSKFNAAILCTSVTIINRKKNCSDRNELRSKRNAVHILDQSEMLIITFTAEFGTCKDRS